MLRARFRRFLAATAVIVGTAVNVHAEAGARPACGGRDLLPELVAASPEAQQRLAAGAERGINGNAVLWRISRPGLAPSYLFGTVHVSDERITRLSPAVASALDSSKRVALEIADASPEALQAAFGKIQDKLVFLDGRNLRQMLDEGELAIMQNGLTSVGFPVEAQAQLRPWFVAMMLAMTECERKRIAAGEKPLDVQLGERARAKGIPVAGLETLQSQLEIMAGVSEADQIKALKATLATYDKTVDAIESMLQRYLARELGKVVPMQAELIRAAGMDPEAMKGFLDALLTVRNPRMRDAALPMLAEGGAFIAVGALHLVGADGLVALFQAAGYEVSPVE